MPTSKSSIDHRDVYYRKGKSAGYRARSAYKLLHLDEEFDLFTGVETAVDLCAAPGSWSQVLGQRLNPSRSSGQGSGSSRVVSVDLQPMAPLPNISILQTDITLPSTIPLVLDALGGRKADLVVCDGAPDVTGVHDLDAYLHSQLLLAAITLSLTLLAPHSTLIFKIFLSPLDPQAALLASQLRCFFSSPPVGETKSQLQSDFSEFDENQEDVDYSTRAGRGSSSGGPSRAGQLGYDVQGRRGGIWVRKPRSSRAGSGEAFIVCRNFDPSKVPLPPAFSPSALEELRTTEGTLTLDSLSSLGLSEARESRDWGKIKGFVGGGDLNPTADIFTFPPESTHPPPISLNVTTSPDPPQIQLKDDASPSSPKALFAQPTPVDAPSAGYFSPKDSSSRRSSPPFIDDSSTGAFLSTSSLRLNPSSTKLNIDKQPRPDFVARTEEVDDGPSRQSSLESIKPIPTPISSSTLPIKPKSRIPPPALPLPLPSEALNIPNRLRAWSNASSTASDIFNSNSSPLVSPALSTSSRTDMFFATSQKEVLPAPPKPLPNATVLGRGLPSSIDQNSDRSASMPVKSSPYRGQGAIWPADPNSVDLTSPATSAQGWQSTRESRKMFGFEEEAAATTSPSTSRLRALSNPMGNLLNPLSSSPTSNYSPTTTRLMKRIPHEPLATLPTQSDVSSEALGGPISPTKVSKSAQKGLSLRDGNIKLLSRPNHKRRESQQLEREQREAREDVSLISGDIVKPSLESLEVGTEEEKNEKGWKLKRKLGEGAFSAVWSATPVSGEGKVSALKLMDRNLSFVDSRTRISFLREVEVLRHISHPSIVAYLDSFTTPSHHVLVLEQLDGGELFDLMSVEENRKRMLLPSPAFDDAQGVIDKEGEGFVRRVFGELTRAVGWLHEVGVVHRDIKLENILFTTNPFTLSPTSTNSIPLHLLPSPLVKLTDFGLSRFISPSAPLLETRCGSESFAAPEIIMGRPYDGRQTDAWAMGVVLYGLIVGELPFDHEDDLGMVVVGDQSPRSGSGTGSFTPDVRTRGRKRMMRIAKGTYTYPSSNGAGSGSSDVRKVIDSLLVRDATKRKKVLELWDEEWFIGPGQVDRPSTTMSRTASGANTPNGIQGVRKRRVLDGFLVEEDEIEEVAHAEH